MRLVVGGIGLIAWLWFYQRGYRHYSAQARQNTPTHGTLLFLGLEWMAIERWSAHDVKRSALYRQMQILEGAEEGPYALTRWAAKRRRDLVCVLGLAPIGWMLHPLWGAAFVAFGALWELERSWNMKCAARRKKAKMIQGLPQMLTQLLLFLQAGGVLEEGWRTTAFSQEGEIFDEMRAVLHLRWEGTPTAEAYRRFGQGLHEPLFREVSSALAQNTEYGGAQLCTALVRVRKEAMDACRRAMQQEAERAAQQMVFPSLLIFSAILLLVLVPLLGQSFGI